MALLYQFMVQDPLLPFMLLILLWIFCLFILLLNLFDAY